MVRDFVPKTLSTWLGVGTTLLLMLAAACSEPSSPAPEAEEDDPVPADREPLRDAAPDGFAIGTAVAGGGHHANQPVRDPFNSDDEYRALIGQEFNSVTPENQLKWEMVHPVQGDYDFGPADEIIDYAEEHGQVVRGHTLVWHNQNPSWLENGDFTPDELQEILRDHIHTVVGRYRGRIQQWDVANEVIDDNGELRRSIWYEALGPDYIADAFRWAHEADPDAVLFLNDYSVEAVNAKSTAYYDLAQDLLADGVPVHGFGMQGHLSTEYGFPDSVHANLERFDELGLATAVTEVDVRMALPDSGDPTEEQLERQASDYGRLLEACLNVTGCRSFTVWGFADQYSWVPGFFTGEGSATLMFDDFTPKPSYFELRRLLDEAG